MYTRIKNACQALFFEKNRCCRVIAGNMLDRLLLNIRIFYYP
jgi:hypothetical protein